MSWTLAVTLLVLPTGAFIPTVMVVLKEPLWFGVVEIGNVREFACLLTERGSEFRMAVAEGCGGNARAEVEVALAVRIKNVAALAVRNGDGEARVRRDDVGIDALLDFGGHRKR